MDITCNKWGKYVSVEIPGFPQILTLCEVEAFGPGCDDKSSYSLLEGAIATQKSDGYPEGLAKNAIDGKTNGCKWVWNA